MDPRIDVLLKAFDGLGYTHPLLVDVAIGVALGVAIGLALSFFYDARE